MRFHLLTLALFFVVAASGLQAQEAPQLDRFNLLQYRASSDVKPVTTPAEWQHRRTSILAGMQQVMG
ncbi:MAG: hypothetical protein ACI92S_003226, partial [Planctomycetaceae bacterium]